MTMSIFRKLLSITVVALVVIIFLSAANVYHNPFLLKGTLGLTILVYLLYMIQNRKQRNA